jgi:hypothetical protein
MCDRPFLSRYRSGDFHKTWKELQALGEISDPVLKAEALAVAREIAKRVKFDLEKIVNYLARLGFKFADPARTVVPSQPNAVQKIDRFEQQWGLLPLSVRAWYECIHSINLTAWKPFSQELLRSLDSTSIAFSFSDCTDLCDRISDGDSLSWHLPEMTILSLEESTNLVLQAQEQFKRDWAQGKVDNWTRNYFLENLINPEPIAINFLPIGMTMSNCEPMFFKVGTASADCVISDEDGEVSFVDFLRSRLLSAELLNGYCSKNEPHHYLYFGKFPEKLNIRDELISELLLF